MHFALLMRILCDYRFLVDPLRGAPAILGGGRSSTSSEQEGTGEIDQSGRCRSRLGRTCYA